MNIVFIFIFQSWVKPSLTVFTLNINQPDAHLIITSRVSSNSVLWFMKEFAYRQTNSVKIIIKDQTIKLTKGNVNVWENMRPCTGQKEEHGGNINSWLET